MKEWYLRQSSQDRIIVICVAALSVVGLLYAFVWYPINTGLDNNRTLLVSKQQTLAKVQSGAAQLKALGGGTGTQLKQTNKAPFQLIDELIRNAGIKQPERIDPSGNNGARVQMNEVEFDKLVPVLAQLELYGISVKTMNITRKNEGTVTVRFNIEKS